MENESYQLNEALDYYNNGEYQQAINKLAIGDIQKTNAAAYYELMGYCCYQLNKFDNAAWYLEKAIIHNPTYNLLHDWLGLAYARAGQDENALKEILYLYNNYPGSDLFTYRYGYFELTHERFDTALPLMLEAFAINPDVHEDMNFYIGLCYYKLEDDNQAALTYLQKHIEKKPDFPDAYYLLGCIYDRLDDTDMAIRYLSQALWYKEDHDDALFNRFRIKKEIYDYDGAEKDLAKLLQVNPQYIQVRNNEGKQLRVTSITINRSNGDMNFLVDTENPLG